MLKCKRQDDSFYYGHNLYKDTYLFSRPDPIVWGAEALQDYEQCKSYILQNPKYETARSDTGLNRQVRTHTCFSFCASGEDKFILGDDRPQCVDLKPSERDQIVCLYPNDQCERTSVAGEVALSERKVNKLPVDTAFAPALGIIAMLLANPIQFLFELACMFLFKYKANKDSAK